MVDGPWPLVAPMNALEVRPVAAPVCHCAPATTFGTHDNTVSMRNPFTDQWVCIDTCLATYIGWLWHQGIRTLNSCCGHGRRPPTIAVHLDYVDAARAVGLTAPDPAWPDRPEVFRATATNPRRGGREA